MEGKELPGMSSNITRKLPMVFAGKVLPVFFLLLITVIYSRQLSYDDYGSYQTMWVLISMAGTFLLFGLPSVMLSWPADSFRVELRKNLKKLLAAYSVLCLAVMSLVWFAANEYSLQQKVFLVVLLLLQSACIIIDTRFIKFNLLNPYILINALYAILFFLIHLYFLKQPFVLEHLMLLLIALSFLKLVIGVFFSAPSDAPHSEIARPVFIKHWLYTGLNEVTGIIGRWLDKIVLLYLLSASEFAIYFNGSFEIPLFAVMISAMENVMLANISQDPGNRQASTKVFRDSFKLLSLIAFPVFCFFLFAHREFYTVIFEHKYDASIPVFLISLLMIPLRITHYGVILQSYGKANRLLLGSVIDIMLSLLLMLVLYPAFGTVGIMLALVISTYLQVIYYLFVSAKILQVNITDLIPWKYLAGLLLILFAFFYGLSFIKPLLTSMAYLILMFSIAAAIVLISVFRHFSINKKAIE